MRRIFDETALMATVPQEVTEAIDREALRVKNVVALKMIYDGREKRPTKATILSAIVLHYRSLPQAQRDQILSEGVETLRNMMEEREPEVATS
jgi:hypothetical protein